MYARFEAWVRNHVSSKPRAETPHKPKAIVTSLAITTNWDRNQLLGKEDRQRRPRGQRPQAADGLAPSSVSPFANSPLGKPSARFRRNRSRKAPQDWLRHIGAMVGALVHKPCATKPREVDPTLADHLLSPAPISACHPGTPKVFGGLRRARSLRSAMATAPAMRGSGRVNTGSGISPRAVKCFGYYAALVRNQLF